MLAVLFLYWHQRTVISQLSDFYCIPYHTGNPRNIVGMAAGSLALYLGPPADEADSDPRSVGDKILKGRALVMGALFWGVMAGQRPLCQTNAEPENTEDCMNWILVTGSVFVLEEAASHLRQRLHVV